MYQRCCHIKCIKYSSSENVSPLHTVKLDKHVILRFEDLNDDDCEDSGVVGCGDVESGKVLP